MTHLDTASFSQAINGNQPAVVDFWAVWCMPCKIFSPIIEDVANKLDGKADFYKVNVDENNDIAAKYEITSIPTLIVFKGGEAVDRMEGVRAKEDVIAMIEKHL